MRIEKGTNKEYRHLENTEVDAHVFQWRVPQFLLRDPMEVFFFSPQSL